MPSSDENRASVSKLACTLWDEPRLTRLNSTNILEDSVDSIRKHLDRILLCCQIGRHLWKEKQKELRTEQKKTKRKMRWYSQLPSPPPLSLPARATPSTAILSASPVSILHFDTSPNPSTPGVVFDSKILNGISSDFGSGVGERRINKGESRISKNWWRKVDECKLSMKEQKARNEKNEQALDLLVCAMKDRRRMVLIQSSTSRGNRGLGRPACLWKWQPKYSSVPCS